MNYKDPLSDGKSRLELIDYMGNDLSIVNDARASFAKTSANAYKCTRLPNKAQTPPLRVDNWFLAKTPQRNLWCFIRF